MVHDFDFCYCTTEFNVVPLHPIRDLSFLKLKNMKMKKKVFMVQKLLPSGVICKMAPVLRTTLII